MKYLGIDFGLKRIGLATSEGKLASPWKVVEGKSLDDLMAKVVTVAQAGGFDKVVVGVPEGKIGKLTKKFVKILQEAGFVAVEADETLSTQQANKIMVEIGISKRRRRLNDAYSAALILQNYLDSLKTLDR